METQYSQNLVFENMWKKEDATVFAQVKAIWKRLVKMDETTMNERARQLVYVVKNQQNEIIAISTAFKVHIKQLKNFFYVYRCLVTPENRIPGMDAKLTVLTRDFLESIHATDIPDVAIGLIALVENPQLKERNLAIWPASGFVYIGNSREGKHIRVYYFKGARIIP
jgi:hypothetical protein